MEFDLDEYGFMDNSHDHVHILSGRRQEYDK
jgi:hypothetical protein